MPELSSSSAEPTFAYLARSSASRLRASVSFTESLVRSARFTPSALPMAARVARTVRRVGESAEEYAQLLRELVGDHQARRRIARKAIGRPTSNAIVADQPQKM